MYKIFFYIFSFCFLIILISPSVSFAQVPSMVCLGNCPAPSTAPTAVAAQSQTNTEAATTTTPSTAPTQTNTQPTPTVACQPAHSTIQTEQTDQHRRNHWGRRGKGKSNGNSNGFMQAIIQMIKQLFQLIMQLLGGQSTTNTNTNTNTTPTPTPPTCPTNTPAPTSNNTTPAPTSNSTTTAPTSSSNTPAPTSNNTTPAPTTTNAGTAALHFTIAVNSTQWNQVIPLGFNMVEVGSASELDSLPAGVMGLAWIDTCQGAPSSSTVQQYAGKTNLWGFYIADEPSNSSGQFNCPSANIKAGSDAIHAVLPNTKTFIVLLDEDPAFFNTADYLGVDPYPCHPSGCTYSEVGDRISAAINNGAPVSKLIPVYQAFSQGSDWAMPTAAEMQQIVAEFAKYIPNPAFDYVWTWDRIDADKSLMDSPELQQFFKTHNGK